MREEGGGETHKGGERGYGLGAVELKRAPAVLRVRPVPPLFFTAPSSASNSYPHVKPVPSPRREEVAAAIAAVELRGIVETAAVTDYQSEPLLIGYGPVRGQFIEAIGQLDFETLVALSVTVHGFMTRPFDMLDLGEERNELAVEVLERAGSRWDVDPADFATLADHFGGHLEPTSLLLHFANPDRYPIWDADVFAYVVGRDPQPGELRDMPAYIAFAERMRELAASIQAVQAAKLIRQRVADVSRLFAVNAVMLAAGAAR